MGGLNGDLPKLPEERLSPSQQWTARGHLMQGELHSQTYTQVTALSREWQPCYSHPKKDSDFQNWLRCFFQSNMLPSPYSSSSECDPQSILKKSYSCVWNISSVIHITLWLHPEAALSSTILYLQHAWLLILGHCFSQKKNVESCICLNQEWPLVASGDWAASPETELVSGHRFQQLISSKRPWVLGLHLCMAHPYKNVLIYYYLLLAIP